MEPFIGQIQAFGFNFAPRGWAFCNGNLMAISQWQALYSLVGTTYGGDGRTTFALPDLRGRSIVHVGQSPGLSNITWGQKSGLEQLTLTPANLPAHTHTANLRLGNGLGNTATATDNKLAASAGSDTIYNAAGFGSDNLAAGTVSIDNTGAGQSIASRNPYLGIYVSIALVGIYPSRS